MYLALDLGNVVCEIDFKPYQDYLQLVEGMTYEQSWFYMEGVQAHQDLGLTNIAQEAGKLKETHPDDMLKVWNQSVIVNEMMFDFFKEYQEQGVKIALLSNIGMDHTKYLKETCPELFYHTVEHLSLEVGARKPTKLYFQSFLMDHPEFKGATYIDDREENLKTGEQYDFKTIHFCLDKIINLPASERKKQLKNLKAKIDSNLLSQREKNSRWH